MARRLRRGSVGSFLTAVAAVVGLLFGTVAAALLIAPLAGAAPGDPARPGGTTVQAAPDLPAFEVRIATLTAAERRAMTPSVWRRGCPVPLARLRGVHAVHIGFDGRVHRGTVVVHAARARGIAAVLRELYDARYPIRRMHPIENPYVTRGGAGGGRKASEPFLDRRDVRPGMATPGSIVVRAFEARGWRWGGRWTDPIDLQHFSTTGR